MKKIKINLINNLFKPKDKWFSSIYWSTTSISIVKFQHKNNQIHIAECNHYTLDSSKTLIQNLTTILKKTSPKILENTQTILSLPSSETTVQTLSLPKISTINQYIAIERQLNTTKEYIWDYQALESIEETMRFITYKTTKEFIDKVTTITDSKNISISAITPNSRKIKALISTSILPSIDSNYIVLDYDESIIKISVYQKSALLFYRYIPFKEKEKQHSNVIDNELTSLCISEIEAIETYFNSKKEDFSLQQLYITGPHQKELQEALTDKLTQETTCPQLKLDLNFKENSKKEWQKHPNHFYTALAFGLEFSNLQNASNKSASVNLLSESYKNRPTESMARLIILTLCPIIIGGSFLLNKFLNIQEKALFTKSKTQHQIFKQQNKELQIKKEAIQSELAKVRNILSLKKDVISFTHADKLLYKFSQLNIKELYFNQIHISNNMLDLNGKILTKDKTIGLPKLLNILNNLDYLYEINYTLTEDEKPLSNFKVRAKFKAFKKSTYIKGLKK